MIKAEAILPRGFKADVFSKNFRKAGQRWLEGVGRDFSRSHKDFSAKNQPQHKTTVRVNSNELTFTVEIQGLIYTFVHEGTRPHKIRAKRGKKLAISSGYRPKTIPGTISSLPGGTYGPTIYRDEVNHPGTKGRRQSKAIKANQEKPFYRDMEEALRKSVKECGHAM